MKKEVGVAAVDIAKIVGCFTFYGSIVFLVKLSDTLFKVQIHKDFNDSECIYIDLNSTPTNGTAADADIASAISLVSTFADGWLTFINAPLYYLPFRLASAYANKQFDVVRALFYIGGISALLVIGLSVAGMYAIPALLSLPIFNVSLGAQCFLDQLFRKLTYTFYPMEVKTWLEQFLFCAGLMKYALVPSLCFMVLSLIADYICSLYDVPFYYMFIPMVVELGVAMSHILTFSLEKNLKELRLHAITFSWSVFCEQIKAIYPACFWFGFSVAIELFIPSMTGYFAARVGGEAPQIALIAQQSFYLSYIVQTAMALKMSMEIRRGNLSQVNKHALKIVMCAGLLVWFPVLIISIIINLLTASDISKSLMPTGLGFALACTEYVKVGFANAARGLGCEAAVFFVMLLALCATGGLQYELASSQGEDENNDFVAFCMLLVQLAVSFCACIATAAITGCHLFKGSVPTGTAAQALLDPVSGNNSSDHALRT